MVWLDEVECWSDEMGLSGESISGLVGVVVNSAGCSDGLIRWVLVRWMI